MRRNVYLQGELAEKFGKKFTVNADSYAEIFKCINVNRPGFMPYLRKCHEDEIGFIIETHNGAVEDEHELLVPLQPGDITLSIAPAGSKSGIGKILLAIVIVVVMIYAPQLFFTTAGTGAAAGTTVAVGTGFAGLATATGLSGWGLAAGLLAVNLALMGMQQVMAPDPAVDKDSPTNYIFTGSGAAQTEGDPVPLLYGELRVPGRPIAIEVLNGHYSSNNVTYTAAGGIVNHQSGAGWVTA